MTMQVEVRRKTQWVALDQKVIAVAVEGEVGDWTAYIGAVEGKNHYEEWRQVAKHGSTLPRKVAEAIFPDFAEQFTWRG
jgi:hypothetical protein